MTNGIGKHSGKIGAYMIRDGWQITARVDGAGQYWVDIGEHGDEGVFSMPVDAETYMTIKEDEQVQGGEPRTSH